MQQIFASIATSGHTRHKSDGYRILSAYNTSQRYVTYTPREARAHPTCMLIPILWPKYADKADKANVADEAEMCATATCKQAGTSACSPSLSISSSCTSSRIQVKRLTWTKQIINYSATALRVSTLSAHEICTMCSVIEVNKKTKCLNFWTSKMVAEIGDTY